MYKIEVQEENGLWHDVRGWKTPYPEVMHSLFFPLSVSIPDADRKVRPK